MADSEHRRVPGEGPADQVSRAFELVDPQAQPLDRELLEWTEILGLLPYGLEEAEVPAHLKVALLESLRPAQRDSVSGANPLAPPHRRAEMLVPPSSPWLRWVAAAAFLATVVLAALSGWLYDQLQSQDERIAALEERLSLAPAGATLAQRESNLVRDHLRMVTSPSTVVCRLRAQHPEQRLALGAVFMDPATSRWLLTASRLRSTGAGLYQIWMESDGAVIGVGSFRVQNETSRIEIGDVNLPPSPTAVMITFEQAIELETPRGPMVLYGDEQSEMQ